MGKSHRLEVEREEFFAAMGAAIRAWSSVEGTAMTQLFLTILQPANPLTGGAVFAAAFNLSAKRDMITAAFANSLTPFELLSAWSRLDERIRKAGLRRNKVAHWPMVGFTDETGHRYLLAPGLQDPQDSARIKVDNVSLNDLKNMKSSFEKLTQDIHDFRKNQIVPALPQIYPGLEGRQPLGGVLIRANLTDRADLSSPPATRGKP